MNDLVRHGLRHHAGRWAWTVVAAAVSSSSLAAVVAVATAAFGQARDADHVQLVSAVTGNVLVFTAIAACAVLASTAALVVRTQAREHALWKLVGIPAADVQRVVTTQLAVLGGVGGVLGIALVPPLAHWTAHQWSAYGVLDADASIPLALPMLLAPLMGAALCAAGGYSVARRAAKTPELQALREASAPASRLGWVHVCLAGALTLALASLPVLQIPHVRTLPDMQDLPEIPSYLMGSAASILVMMIALSLAPLTLKLATSCVARLPFPGMAWQVAGATARLRAAHSAVMTFPYALAMSVVGVCQGTGNLVTGEVSPAEVMVAFGLVILVCWTGGVAAIAVLGQERSRDGVLLAMAGGRPGMVAAVVVLEGVVHAASAWLFAAVLTLVGMVITGATAGLPWWVAVARGPWVVLTELGLLTLATTVAAVVVPAIAGTRKPLLDHLRVAS